MTPRSHLLPALPGPRLSRPGLAGAAAAALIALLAGCASTMAGSEPDFGVADGTGTTDGAVDGAVDGTVDSGPLPQGPVAGLPCAATAAGASAPQEVLPASFVPVEARLCTFEQRTDADGEWQVRVITAAHGGLERLADALRTPSEPAGAGPCRAIGFLQPDLTLIDDAGRSVRPTFPVDECGLPLPAAQKALSALEFTTMSETKVKLTTSAAALKSGCAQDWKNMMRIYAQEPSPVPAEDVAAEPNSATGSAPGSAPDSAPDSGSGTGFGVSGSAPGSVGAAGPAVASVCVYRVPGTGGDRDVGTFERGGSVGVDDVRTALTTVTAPAAACTRDASRFAVIGGSVYVELDGCDRVRTDGYGLAEGVLVGSGMYAATPALLELISTAVRR